MILAALAVAAALQAPLVLQAQTLPPAGDAPTCDEARRALRALNEAAHAAGSTAAPLGLVCQGGKALRIVRAPNVIDGFNGPGFNVYQPSPAPCGDIQRRVLEDQRETLRRLGSLPNAAAIYAVERKIGPCGVPAPMGYHPPSLPGKADHPPQ